MRVHLCGTVLQAGVLSEAALALEAEVQAHPGNADAWRLLGTVHAENDDDIRVRLVPWLVPWLVH